MLCDVSFALAPGEAAAIMGPSGSGKSSLLYLLGALEPPTSGTVTLDGRNPFQLGADELAAFRNTDISVLFPENVGTNRALGAFYMATGHGASAEPYFKKVTESINTDEAQLSLARQPVLAAQPRVIRTTNSWASRGTGVLVERG